MIKNMCVFTLLLFVGMLISCSGKLPEGSYKVGFDNMEPEIMKGAIVKIEEITDKALLEVGDYVLLNWEDRELDERGYIVFRIGDISHMVVGGTSYYNFRLTSSSGDQFLNTTADEFLGIVIDIKNPS